MNLAHEMPSKVLEMSESVEDLLNSIFDAPKEEYVPYLINAYGLGFLLPYIESLDDFFKNGLDEAREWKSYANTPKAIKIALSWIGFPNAKIEEAGPCVNWNHYQVDPRRKPTYAELEKIKAVCSLSAPARSKLVRIFHKHDVRRLRLGSGKLDTNILSKDSGYYDKDGVLISIGK